MRKTPCPEVDCFIPDLSSRDKWSAITEIVDSLAAAGRIGDREAVLREVVLRERSLSTGMTHGLAIPHARTTVVTDKCVGLGLSREGIPFDSIDGQPARAIFLVLTSPGNRGPHLECLAEISRLYSDPVWRDRLLLASGMDDIRLLLQQPR